MKTLTGRRAPTWALLAALALSTGALAQAPTPSAARPATTPAQAAPTPQAPQRLALVIGNGAYKEAPLSNPANDARAMAKALRSAGFTVLLHTDLPHRDMLNALRDFGNRLRQGGVGIFYFAGHGMQVKGRNFLVPVGADIQREDELAYAAVDAQSVLDKMEAAGNGTNLVILDACRNNPFARSFRSASQGLAQMEAPVGTLVAFATAPGSVASDGNSDNGLYTQHLLSAMRQPGAKVEDVFKQVRAAVRRDSAGKQIPWESTSLEGDFFFHQPPEPKPALDPVLALDDALWDSVNGTREATELRAYLRRFPQGRHLKQAQAQLAALSPSAPVAVAAPAAPAAGAAPAPRPPPSTSAAPAPPTATAPAPAGVVAAAATPAAAAAGVASPPVQAAAAKPTERRPAKPPSNLQGYTVGDRWNYQVVDKYRGEVVRNYSLRVGRIDSDGGWSSGAARFDALGRLVEWTNGAGEQRAMLPHGGRWWANMLPGEKRSFEYEDRWPTQANQVKLDSRVVGIESVRVPAGEFKAWRINHKGTQGAIGRPGFGSVDITVWYVPELHTLVAVDINTTWDGRPGTREREELTSFTLVNHPGLN